MGIPFRRSRMTKTGMMRSWAAGIGLGMLAATAAQAAPLTADDAVKAALKSNSQVIGAEATVLGARSSVYGSYSSLLPRVSGTYSRSAFRIDNQTGGRNIGGGLTTPITSIRPRGRSTGHGRRSTSPASPG
jgi:outer membrane protein TolC